MDLAPFDAAPRRNHQAKGKRMMVAGRVNRGKARTIFRPAACGPNSEAHNHQRGVEQAAAVSGLLSRAAIG